MKKVIIGASLLATMAMASTVDAESIYSTLDGTKSVVVNVDMLATVAPIDSVEIGLGFQGLSDLGAYKDEVRPYKGNHAIFDQAYVEYNKNNIEGKVGRFYMNETLLNSDFGHSTMKSAFEGISASYKIKGNIIKGAWINKVSGPAKYNANGSSLYSFGKINDLAAFYTGTKGKNKGAFLVGLDGNQEAFNYSLSAFIIPDSGSEGFVDIGYNFGTPYKITANGEVLQYKSKKSGTPNINAYGVKAETLIYNNTKLKIAYNKVNDYSLPIVFNANPLYTTMEFTNAYNKKDVKSGLVALNYKDSVRAGYGKIGYFKSLSDKTLAYELGYNRNIVKGVKAGVIVGYNYNDVSSNTKNAKVFVSYKY